MHSMRVFAGGACMLTAACSAPARSLVADQPRAAGTTAAMSGSSANKDGGPTSPRSASRAIEAASGGNGKGHDAAPSGVRAKHGGIVTMAKTAQGLLGIEAVVERDGAVRLYAMDPSGTAISPDEIDGAVTCERGPVRTTVTVVPNHVTGAAEGRCAALDSQVTTVTYELRLRGIVHEWRLHVPPTGTVGMGGTPIDKAR